MEITMIDQVLMFVLIIGMWIAFFLLIRKIVMWYFKIPKIISELAELKTEIQNLQNGINKSTR